jgi:AhpD family alkylhydroperoxidase
MTAVRVFDPAMCCSTGICGPSVDPELVRFAADLDWLKTQGISVERFNLSQQPAAFAEDAAVRAALETKGEAGLPLVKVNGEVKSSGAFPSRDELAAWAGLGGPTTSLYTGAVAELVAIGASIAAGCEPCLAFHDDKARKLGVSAGDIARAVATAQSVKAAKANADSAERRDPEAKPKSGGCCGSSKAVASAPAVTEKVAEKSGGCCGSSKAVESAPATSAAKPKSGGCC